MADIVVTVPREVWWEWLAEGDLPGEPDSGTSYHYFMSGKPPNIKPGERVYVVAHNRLRGYAPLTAIEYPLPSNRSFWWPGADFALVRQGGAVAVTIEADIRGFRGYRMRWWNVDDERPYPDWKTDGVKR